MAVLQVRSMNDEMYEALGRRAAMDCFGEIKASLSSAGITVDDFDLQIGCTALMFNYTIVTNNTKLFQKIPGLKLANWAQLLDG